MDALDRSILAYVKQHGSVFRGPRSFGHATRTVRDRWARLERTKTGELALAVHKHTVAARIKPHDDRVGHALQSLREWDGKPALEQVVDPAPRPFAVKVPAPAKKRTGRYVTAVLYGDAHYDQHDLATIAVVLGVIREVQPDVVVNMGDLVDCYSISRFDKDPKRLLTLQTEIDLAREHLAQVAQVAPKAERYLLEGNHEDRLRRILWTLPAQHQALATLRSVQKATEWTNLLQLHDVGFTWVPTFQQESKNILPKMILTHGSLVRKWSGLTAQGELAKYGKSGASGHTHRLGEHWHRDSNGNHFWLETGCCCAMDPRYVIKPDWQAGCKVVTLDTKTGAPHIETVYVWSGNAAWRRSTLEGK